MRRLALLCLVVAGCAHEPTNEAAPARPSPTSQPGVGAPPAPPAPPTTTVTPPAPAPKAATRVELTAVTLADDCGGSPPWGPPVRTAQVDSAKKEKAVLAADEDPPAPRARSQAKADMGPPMHGARAKRRCEQTSMQLAIIAGDAATLQVKSVELFDESGTSLGTLTASKPTRWSDASGMYEAWDEKVTAGATTSVSYVLSQPRWSQIGDRWNRTYTLKAVVSVGGVDQTTQKDVTLSAPTSLPPNVKT